MIKRVKKEFFYLRKAFFEYKKGPQYIKNKYFLAKKILNSKKVFEKPINNQNYSVHILVSHTDALMSIWSLASFYSVSKVIGQLYIHSDGTLTNHDIKLFRQFFPSSKLVESKDFPKNYSETLDKFPILKKFRTTYDNFSFKKIIDIYFVSDKKFHLILDSDILWFKNPAELEVNIESQGNKSYMQKNNTAIYATFKDGTKLDDDLASYNAGIILYSKETFDMEKFNEFLEKLDENNPKNLHFADQAGHAYCLKNLEALPSSYQIKEEVRQTTVARHYTGPRRPLFYIEGLPIIKDKV